MSIFSLFSSCHPQKPFISRCGSVLTGAFYIIYTYKSSGFVYFFYYFPGFKSFSFNLSSRIALGQHNEVRLSKFTSLWILGGHFSCVFFRSKSQNCVFVHNILSHQASYSFIPQNIPPLMTQCLNCKAR